MRGMLQTTILDDSEQYLRAREAEAMCDHVWIFEARTLSTQPVRRRCGMCGVYRMEPRCREPGIQTHGGPDQEKPSGRAALGVALVLARPAVANWWISNREGSVKGGYSDPSIDQIGV